MSNHSTVQSMVPYPVRLRTMKEKPMADSRRRPKNIGGPSIQRPRRQRPHIKRSPEEWAEASEDLIHEPLPRSSPSEPPVSLTVTAHKPGNTTSSTKGQGWTLHNLYSSTHIANMYRQTTPSAICILSDSKPILHLLRVFGTMFRGTHGLQPRP